MRTQKYPKDRSSEHRSSLCWRFVQLHLETRLHTNHQNLESGSSSFLLLSIYIIYFSLRFSISLYFSPHLSTSLHLSLPLPLSLSLLESTFLKSYTTAAIREMVQLMHWLDLFTKRVKVSQLVLSHTVCCSLQPSGVLLHLLCCLLTIQGQAKPGEVELSELNERGKVRFSSMIREPSPGAATSSAIAVRPFTPINA